MRLRCLAVAACLLAAPAAARAQLAPHDDDPVVLTGPLTDDAARALALFDAGRYAEAAPRLLRVFHGDTLDDQGNRQLAQYHLAIALDRLGLPAASLSIFSAIAGDARHLRFEAALPWLATLATELPDPTDVIALVGRYGPRHLERVRDPRPRSHLWFLLGRYKYQGRHFEEAIACFEKIEPASAHHLEAQFFMGVSYLQLGKTVPSAKAFGRIVTALDGGGLPAEETARLRDLAYLSKARVYYTGALRGFGECCGPSIDAAKLSAAALYWGRVTPGGAFWLDALLEQAWVFFMAGDYPRALGNLDTVQSPFFERFAYPEADLLRATIAWTLCNYDDAVTLSARLRLRYEPLQRELAALLLHLDEGTDARVLGFFHDVRAGRAGVSREARPLVEKALSDRQLARSVAMVGFLDDELARLQQAPSGVREGDLGREIDEALAAARALAVERGAALVRARLTRARTELETHLLLAVRILLESIAGQREPRSEREKARERDESLLYDTIRPDHEHASWPFDGEYWRDELGSYREVVRSRCVAR